jgi:hypothetical protein
MDDRLSDMRRTLLSAVNPDGGWGYYSGKASRLEPTCWALLALFPSDPTLGGQLSAHRDFLQRSRREDGLFIEAAIAGEHRPNLGFNALAAILLDRHDLGIKLASDFVVSALVQHKGIKLRSSDLNRQDNALQGWGWIDETFSWVEPTSWCLLALKKALKKTPSRSNDSRARIQEAERILIDRCCDAGGWNYGNSNMLGQTLHPYVSTTAAGLLAMQDRRQEPCIVRSLAFLSQHRLAEQSAMALGLTLIALRVYDLPRDDVRDRLLAQWDRTAFLGNAHLTALALYALGGESEGGEAFRV